MNLVRPVAACATGLLLWISAVGCRQTLNSDGLVDLPRLRDFTETAGYTNGLPIAIRFTPEGDKVLFLRSGPRDRVRNLYEMDATTGTVRVLLRAEDILQGAAEQISPEEKARRERMREGGRGISAYQLSKDGRHILVALSGRLYVIARADRKVTALPDGDKGTAIDPQFSPNGTYVACVRNHDVYVIDWQADRQWPVTSGGSADVTHGEAEFVAAEEMGRHSGTWWSDDSRFLAYEEADLRDVEVLRIADAFHPERAPQPWRYPRAGTPNAKVRLGIVPVAGGDTTWVNWDHDRYPYLATVRWDRYGTLTLLVQNRRQTEQVLYRVGPTTGKTTPLLHETDPAWLQIFSGMPRWLADGGEFLWLTERAGRRQIELHTSNGKLQRTYDPGGIRIDGIAAVDEEHRRMLVLGGEQPTQTLLYLVSLETGDASMPDPHEAAWSATASRNWKTLVLTRSGLDGRRAMTVVSTGPDGGPNYHDLPSAALTPPYVPNWELTTIEAPSRMFHAAIIRPRNFVAWRRYPVLLRVYAGPGHNMVTANALGQRLHRAQWLADQGFVVVSFDGRGTPRRGRDWERAIKGDFIDLPLTDQVDALRAAADRFHEMDLSRVGVYGWSFGGYFSAMAILKRPDVFHAAVAGAPVVDWHDYDTHYTERYLGLPQDDPEAYRRSNVLTAVGRLERPLLVIHGTADDNVYFLHSLKLTDALFRSGAPCQFLPLSGFTHSPREPDVQFRLWERIAAFFKHELQQSTPAPLPAPGA